MVPIGAIINFDGRALYEVMAVVFVAMLNGVKLGVADLSILGWVIMVYCY